MELGNRIKQHRQEMQLSQEDLAERVYVSRQTISNWETGKSYPDVHSLILLSEIFHVSLDILIKGDIDMMKEVVRKEETEKWNRYVKFYGLTLVAACLLTVPLTRFLSYWGFIPLVVFMAIAFYYSIKMRELEKKNDIKSYKELLAFLDGRTLDEAEKQRARDQSNRNRIFRTILLFMCGVVTALGMCALMGILLKIFLP